MSSKPKHVVSVSLGSSRRDARIETDLMGQSVLIERRGTDGDRHKAAQILRDLDGKVDAFGLGGTDLFIQVAGQRYYLRESRQLAKNARQTPVVCGAGLKDTLERKVVQDLDAMLHWQGKRVLMLSAVDRFGMAEELDALGADVVYADLIFILGLPLPLKRISRLAQIARVFAPMMVQLPISWLYPTGAKQENSEPSWRKQYFENTEVIAGDFHFVKRYAPEHLSDKIILTNTTTSDDVKMLRERGVRALITTTPRFEGRSLSSNMLEAAFVAVSGKFPLSDTDYRELIERSGIKPDVLELNP